jgi:hypothetical protein
MYRVEPLRASLAVRNFPQKTSAQLLWITLWVITPSMAEVLDLKAIFIAE